MIDACLKGSHRGSTKGGLHARHAPSGRAARTFHSVLLAYTFGSCAVSGKHHVRSAVRTGFRDGEGCALRQSSYKWRRERESEVSNKDGSEG